jgi:hypothetical protein
VLKSSGRFATFDVVLNPASFVDFEQGIARTHNCAGERPRRSHVIS